MTGNFLFKTTRVCLALWQADENVLQRLWRWTGPLRAYVNAKWELGNFVFSISSLIIGALALLAAVLFSRYLRAFIERRMARHKYLDPGVQFTILRLVHYVVITIGFVSALKLAPNADFTSHPVIFTALSAGIG